MAKSKKAATGRARRRTGGSGKRVVVATARSAAPARIVQPAPARPKLRKTYLGKGELEEFRQMLVERRRTLLGDLSGMEAQTANQQSSGNLSTMPTHMADVGTDNFEHEFTLGLLESEQALLREIDGALRRIDEKTYGICLGTGEPIPKARLKAQPWAKYTVEYARMLEKGLVRPPEPPSGEEDVEEEPVGEDEEEPREAPEEDNEQQE